MAIKITDDCINCGACQSECPNNAIYEGAEDWCYKDGTVLSGDAILPGGKAIDADFFHEALSDDIYYIVPDKCTECKGFYDEPQCQMVCPVDCCIDDPEHRESEEALRNRQVFLHKK